MSSSSSYTINFVGMVLPGDDLIVKLCHTSMLTGNIAVSVEMSNSHGNKMFQGTAEVAQPTTVYIFASQCSQEPGMGMLLHALFGKTQMPMYLQFIASLLLTLSRTTQRRR